MISTPTNDWYELGAAIASDTMLAERPPGKKSKARYESDEISRAHRDALLAIARLPDPRTIARYLETGDPGFAEALREAFRSQDPEEYGYLRVRGEFAPYLRSMGLVACGGPFLTLFGMRVRKALLDDGAADD